MAKCYMRWRMIAVLSSLILSLLGYIYFLRSGKRVQVDRQSDKRTNVEPRSRDEIHLATVSCGHSGFSGEKDFERPLALSITMMKSATMFAKKRLNLHVFTEDEMKPFIINEIDSWPKSIQERVSYFMYTVDYLNHMPEDMVQEWRTWYKPCGSFRLFLPIILAPITDAAIYSDNDVVYIKPIDELWAHLSKMDERQVAAISPTTGHPIEVRDDNTNFISSSSGSFQINSGVMLMNFTRMLGAKWKVPVEDRPKKYGTDLLLSYYNQYKDRAEHDQKLLNIIFHFNPEFLYKLPCSWNFKSNFCANDKNICEDAEANGAGAVHGISGSFFGNSNPTFKGLYETFEKYKLGENVKKKLLKRYLAYLGGYATDTYCGKKAKIVVSALKKSLSSVAFQGGS